MKRDMELCRKILFAIEEQHIMDDIISLEIENYSSVQVAYHCEIMYQAGLIADYRTIAASDELAVFRVGGLTWAGNDFLEKVRNDTVWNKTKDVIVKQGLPQVFSVIKDVSTAVISSTTEGAVKAMLGGQS